jgi:hypothetical protein
VVDWTTRLPKLDCPESETPNNTKEIRMSKVYRNESAVFPTLYVENELGGGVRELEVQFGVNDLREVEFSITTKMFGQHDYSYMYLNREDIPALIEFLQEYYDA